MDLQNKIGAKQDYGGKAIVVFIMGIGSQKSFKCLMM
jgi:hypothetical protein